MTGPLAPSPNACEVQFWNSAATRPWAELHDPIDRLFAPEMPVAHVLLRSIRTIPSLQPATSTEYKAGLEWACRYGHPDATMILIAYRHGLRANELVDLR